MAKTLDFLIPILLFGSFAQSSLLGISTLGRGENLQANLISHIIALLASVSFVLYTQFKLNNRGITLPIDSPSSLSTASSAASSPRKSPSTRKSLDLSTPSALKDLDEKIKFRETSSIWDQIRREATRSSTAGLSLPFLFAMAAELRVVAYQNIPLHIFLSCESLSLPLAISLSILFRQRKKSNVDAVALMIIIAASSFANSFVVPESDQIIRPILGLSAAIVSIILRTLALSMMENVFKRNKKAQDIILKNLPIIAMGTFLAWIRYCYQTEIIISFKDEGIRTSWQKDLIVIFGQVGFLLITPFALKYTSNLEFMLATSLSIFPILILDGFQYSWLSAIPLIISISLLSIPKSAFVIPKLSTRVYKSCFLAGIILASIFRWSGVFHFERHFDRAPTVAIINMDFQNSQLLLSARECGWGLRPRRSETTSPYGSIVKGESGPFIIADTDQFSLDDTLAVRFQEYPKLVTTEGSTSLPKSDFYFLPLLTMWICNTWKCRAPTFEKSIQEQINWIRNLINSENSTETNYPKFILPVSGIRYSLEETLLVPELMAEFTEKIILVSIEGAPHSYQEQLKYVIDVPYPTRFHLSRAEVGESKWKKLDKEDLFHSRDRPNLVSYSAAISHPWNHDQDTFNGFPLRRALQITFSSHIALYRSSPLIDFRNIQDPADGHRDLSVIYEGMRSSIFCPQPPGDSPSRRSFYDSILNGCIPVIFREFSYNRLFPNSLEMDSSLFTVFIPENDIIARRGDDIITRLSLISPEEILKKQEHLKSIARKIQWTIPPTQQLPLERKGKLIQNAFSEDAFGMLLKELVEIKKGNWEPRKLIEDRRIVEK